MARPRKEKELLVVVPIRLPADFVERIDAEARSSGESRSDVLRKRIDSGESTKPILGTGKPTPQKRERLSKASRADPKLLMQLSRIGSNLNQLAKSVNIGTLVGKSNDSLAVLIELERIERQLRSLSAEHGGVHAN